MTQPQVLIDSIVTVDQLDNLVAQLNKIEKEKHNSPSYPYYTELVQWVDRRKFVAINIGSSGAWMVEKATGEIFNIKGYGIPDYNKKRKADIGNIATVDPEAMHGKRWNYLR